MTVGGRRTVGNANVTICGESYWFDGEGANTAMNRKKLLLVGMVCAGAAVFVVGARGEAEEEVKRLAELMGWKAGTVAADIGAGDGKYAFAAVERVGATGKVYATEIDAKKLAELRSEVAKRKLGNVIVVESKEADTNLPAGCCDAIFLRHVYHHLTKPAEFDAGLVRSLKSGGRLAIIDFAPRAGLEPVEGVPSNRGGHGIPQKIVIEELSAAGLQVEKIVDDWPEDSYCVLFVKR
jgi:ubiquinone/menaquinone biosynthesis C-methylase UbiE